MIAIQNQVRTQVGSESIVMEMANKEIGQWIDAAEFELLSTKERSTVVLELAGRGLVMFRRGARFWVVDREMADSPVEVQPVSSDYQFQLNFEDPRVPHRNDIAFTIFNSDSEQDAWDKLREFLHALQHLKLNLEPNAIDGGE